MQIRYGRGNVFDELLAGYLIYTPPLPVHILEQLSLLEVL
jgi:hypothetical protein